MVRTWRLLIYLFSSSRAHLYTTIWSNTICSIIYLLSNMPPGKGGLLISSVLHPPTSWNYFALCIYIFLQIGSQQQRIGKTPLYKMQAKINNQADKLSLLKMSPKKVCSYQIQIQPLIGRLSEPSVREKALHGAKTQLGRNALQNWLVHRHQRFWVNLQLAFYHWTCHRHGSSPATAGKAEHFAGNNSAVVAITFRCTGLSNWYTNYVFICV